MTDAAVPAYRDALRPIYRLPALSWILVLVGLTATLLSVKDGLVWLFNDLLTVPEYSHGLMIPFVAMFLVWQRRDQFERTSFQGSWAGMWLALLGVTVAGIGKISALFSIEHYAVLVIFSGLLLSLAGGRGLRMLWAPLLILVLMIPLPVFLYQDFSANLQLWSSRLGVWVIRLFGIAVYLEGNVIDLGTYKLQVAEACAGLRYLFPLMTLGFLIAYFFKTVFWKRALLFLSSIPITILMNSLRIGIIGVMVEHWGVGMAEGFLHEFQGWVVFMLSGALMVGEMILFAGTGSGNRPWRELFGLEFPAPTPKVPPPLARPVPSSLYATTALLAVAWVTSLTLPDRAEAIPHRNTFATYANVIGSWTGHRQAMDQIYLDTLMLDDYLLSDYTRNDSRPVNFYIAWYDSQRAGRSAHSPRSCLPAGGWQIQSLTQRALPGIRAGREPLRVNRVLIQQGTQQQLVYYWFQQRGRVITNEYVAKWYLFWDALTRNRTDGALVRLIVALPPGTPTATGDAELTAFAAAAAPTLTPFIPD